MNFHQNSGEVEYKSKINNKPTNNIILKDSLKISPVNQMTITSSKNSNSNLHHTNISAFEDEEVERDEEEEEINSDEYVSSTNLDVETNTYIDDEKSISNRNIDVNNQKGRLNSRYEEIKNKNNMNNIFLNNINNNKTINIEKANLDKNNINNKNMINNNDINKKGHYHFKTEFINYFNNINNRQCITNKGKKVIIENNSIEENNIFTPTNKDKKAMKILKGIILKQIKKDQTKIINKYNTNKLNTINIPEDDLKLMNNNRNRNKREIIYTPQNNDNKNIILNNIDNISNKNINIKNIKQKNIQNNNININIYNKNIIKDIGGINIDGQKYHLIPQKNIKIKTQGRIGKVMNENKNNNNIIYESNNIVNNTKIIKKKEKLI